MPIFIKYLWDITSLRVPGTFTYAYNTTLPTMPHQIQSHTIYNNATTAILMRLNIQNGHYGVLKCRLVLARACGVPAVVVRA